MKNIPLVGGALIDDNSSNESVSLLPSNRPVIVGDFTGKGGDYAEISFLDKNKNPIYQNTEATMAACKPAIEVELKDAEGEAVEEKFLYKKMTDFSPKGHIEASSTLQEIEALQQDYEDFEKQLSKNARLQKLLSNPDSAEYRAYWEAIELLNNLLNISKLS